MSTAAIVLIAISVSGGVAFWAGELLVGSAPLFRFGETTRDL